MKNLWIDDVRPPPWDTWEWAQTYDEAEFMLCSTHYQLASFDHDLGDSHRNGYHLMCMLEQRAAAGKFTPNIIAIHTANPVGRVKMEAARQSIYHLRDLLNLI